MTDRKWDGFANGSEHSMRHMQRDTDRSITLENLENKWVATQDVCSAASLSAGERALEAADYVHQANGNGPFGCVAGVRKLDWRPLTEGEKRVMATRRGAREVSTNSWFRMFWLTRVRGYRVRRLVEKPRQGMLGSIHYDIHWWLAQ